MRKCILLYFHIHIHILLSSFLLAGVIFATVVFAETQNTTLSPDIERIFKKGLAATKQQSWHLAIKYFLKVQKASPTYPPVLMNLGLAHAKAGSELPAIAWLNAYVALSPKAPNLPSVEKEIIRLEVTAETKFRKLIQTAKATTASTTTIPIVGQYHQSDAYEQIAIAQAKVGDIGGAQKTLTQLSLKEVNKQWAYGKVAEAQAKSGDIAGAKETASQIPDDYVKSLAYTNIAIAQAEVSNITGAKKTLALAMETASRITKDGFFDRPNTNIAEAQAKTGDIAGAQKTLTLAMEAASRITNLSGKSQAYVNIAAALTKMDDIAGTRKMLALATEAASRITYYDSYQDSAYADIAKAQAEAGDITEAQETVSRIGNDYLRSMAYAEIAKVQAKAHSIAKAKKIVAALARLKAPEQAKSWTELASNDYLFSEPVVVDFQGFLASLKGKDPQDVAKALANGAEEMAAVLKELKEIKDYWQKRRPNSAR